MTKGRFATSLLIGAFVVLWASSGWAQVVFYGVSQQGDDEATFWSIDPETGEATEVGDVGFIKVSAMDFHPVSGVLYAPGRRMGEDDVEVLITINVETGAGTEVGPTGGHDHGGSYSGMSFRPSDNTLYVYLESRDGLGTFDIDTGEVTDLGDTDVSCCGNAIAFTPDDVLWHSNEDNLHTLNQETAEATVVVEMDFTAVVAAFPVCEDDPRITAMDWTPCAMYVVVNCGSGGEGPNILGTIDLDTGAVTPIGETAAGTTALAWTGAGLVETFYRDADDDGYGSPLVTIEACEAPDGYVDNDEDCNDADDEINPDAGEECDEVDNDCDDEIDEDVTTTYWSDFDRDGFGDPDRTTEACSLPAHHVINSDDCDDTAAAINPDAVEVCDGVDNDCDDEVDEDVTTTYYEDFDRDGFGDPLVSEEACSRPAGYVEDMTDCDDVDRDVHPGAPELCDEIDNDCNDVVDDGATTATFYADADGDGHGDPDDAEEACSRPEGRVTNADDCDDSNELIFPGADEICDELDNNCNTVVDEGVTTTYWEDLDEDGFGDAAVPIEACEMPDGYVDNTDDCDDTDEDIYPGADEECNGIDDDCDGETDEDDVRDTFYLDSDGDGIGDEEYPREACEAPEGYVDNYGDCDDDDETSYPGAEELCDGVDNDCDGTIDDGAETEEYWADDDGDGYGNPDETIDACAEPEGYTDDDTDCNDSSSDIHPNAQEIADGLDNDCDGETDEGLDIGGTDADADVDGGEETDGCNCTSAGQAKNMTFRLGLLRLALSWLGLV